MLTGIVLFILWSLLRAIPNVIAIIIAIAW